MNKRPKQQILSEIADSVACIGLTSFVSSVTAHITGISDPKIFWSFYAGSLIIGTPATYGLLKLAQQHQKQKRNRQHHHYCQTTLMMQHNNEIDHRITSMQSVFVREILDAFTAHGINTNKISALEYMNMNQFIYLINSNYYDKISENITNFNREKLIDMLVEKIALYYQQTNKITFDEKDAKAVLSSCFFINESIQKDIFREFKKSKSRHLKKVIYEIARNDINPNPLEYIEKSKGEREGKVSRFDIRCASNYKKLILLIAQDEGMQEEYGTCQILNWDVEFLQKIITLIGTKYHRRMIEIYENYTNLKLAASFIELATSYAMVNKRTNVGKKEMLATFKEWSYVPFELQKEILDDLFVLEGLDYSMHPYKMTKNFGTKQKIINLSSYKPKQ